MSSEPIATHALDVEIAGLGDDAVDYLAAWDLQRRVHEQVVAGSRADTVLLLRHLVRQRLGLCLRTRQAELPAALARGVEREAGDAVAPGLGCAASGGFAGHAGAMAGVSCTRKPLVAPAQAGAHPDYGNGMRSQAGDLWRSSLKPRLGIGPCLRRGDG